MIVLTRALLLRLAPAPFKDPLASVSSPDTNMCTPAFRSNVLTSLAGHVEDTIPDKYCEPKLHRAGVQLPSIVSLVHTESSLAQFMLARDHR